MKNGFWKGFGSGLILTILVVTLCVTATATSMRSIQVEDGIGITLDGATFIPRNVNGKEVSVFLYNGTTYAPVRAICEAMGLDVTFDTATRTVKLSTGENRWQKEVDGRKVNYTCGEENHSYGTPPMFSPIWNEDGWGLVNISHDTRNYTSNWEYRRNDGKISLKCAYPSTAGFSMQMNSETAAENCQTLMIRGNAADYYQDGKTGLLVWEDRDGVLFYMLGTDTSKEMMVEIAESVAPCTAIAENYSLEWKPSGYSLMDHYQIGDTIEEYWVRDGVAFSWVYSSSQLYVPDWSSSTVDVNGTEATYWGAQEPYSRDLENPAGATMISIPAETEMNTLAWQDPETGIYFRLQGILDKGTMIRMAESIF